MRRDEFKTLPTQLEGRCNPGRSRFLRDSAACFNTAEGNVKQADAFCGSLIMQELSMFL